MNNHHFLIFFIAIILSALSGEGFSQTETTQILELYEPKYKKSQVPVQLSTPNVGVEPYPIIIVQHGSKRDGKEFVGGKGKTDEYSSRIIAKANARGYAVIAIDAFYKKGMKPNHKLSMPRANRYARSIRDELSKYPKLDSNNVFYTGFSYGGRSVLNELYPKSNIQKWKALAASEPDCNSFPKPRKVSVPILILKGGESHYPPRPCAIMSSLFKKKGTDIVLKLFPKSNHFFSHNGEQTEGVAFNGCSDDPVIILSRDKFRTASGKSLTLDEIRKTCLTNNAGSGIGREDLDEAIDSVIDFFDEFKD